MFNTGTLRYDRFLSEAGEDDAGSSFASAVAGHTVLVTGAGGYIGSALVKAIAAARPTRVGAYRQSVDGGELILAGGTGNGYRLAELMGATNPSGWSGVLKVKTPAGATAGYILLYSNP
jgi:NADPH:quinone reductase-like Zn-dependent oxidoreductase